MAHANPIQIQKYLKGVDYPATRQQLIDNAKNLGADESVCASLEQLPDENFLTPADVSQAFRGPSSDDIEAGQGPPPSSRQEWGTNEFLIQVMEDSLAEMELCMLALDHSGNEEVKAFAQSMLDEHGKLGQQVEKLAHSLQVSFPKKMRREHASLIREMSKLNGAAFDARYVTENVRYHQNNLKVFEHYAGAKGDAAVRQLAEAGAKLFDKHLKMARKLEAALAPREAERRS